MSGRALLAWLAGAWCAAVTTVSEGAQAPQPAHPPAPIHAGVAFDTADTCVACHNGLTTPSGEDVSIGVQWRASMMAHSAHDPYWQASVRRETIDHPTKREAIEDECSICHMPMATTLARGAGRAGEVFRLAPSTGGDSDEHRLAADGVSCTLCHQIGPERLGTRESFTGGFVINAPAAGARRMFGPADVEDGLRSVMRSATEVEPARADHISSSELCATCHTLFTEAFDASGAGVGTLPEQVPYLEWRHSAFARERSCQDCHMPAADATPVSSVLGAPHAKMARHAFIGGNFFMLRMLNRFRGELGVTAPSSELDAAANATMRQLAADTASISLARVGISGNHLEADVVVRNLTGHKLPTGYPSRRAWIHLTVRDGAGAVVFESGAVAPNGAIQGNANDADPLAVEPHHEIIRRADDVQIYEAVMGDPGGRPTTGLLQATQYIKDNRLLPRGFDKASAGADIAVRGAAGQDADFTDAGDAVRYVIPLAGAAGPLRVDAELRYQTIAFRWAENLRRYDAAEPRRFVSYYDAMASASSTVLATATARATIPSR